MSTPRSDRATGATEGRIAIGWAILLTACTARTEAPLCGPGTALSGDHCVGAPETDPLLIDDFEDGDTIPAAAQFAPWQCYSFNPGLQPVSCGLASPGADSNFGQYIRFRLMDPIDGVPNATGAGLRTVVAAGTVDLRAHEKFVSRVALLSDDPALPALPAETAVLVRFGCSQSIGYFNAEITVSASWSTVVVPMSGVPDACAAVVDGVDYQILPALSDGQETAGVLWIDNVFLQ